MLGALQCLRVSKTLRDQVGNALAEGRVKVGQMAMIKRMVFSYSIIICCIQDLLYAMIVSNGKLVTLLRPKKHSLHPSGTWLLLSFTMTFTLH